jgi:hypothetical protein
MAGINGFMDYKTEKNQNPIEGNNSATRLISFFTKLRNNGFVDEYLMEQYYYLLTPPENHKFDYEGYQKWKLENSIDYDTSKKLYIIVKLILAKTNKVSVTTNQYEKNTFSHFIDAHGFFFTKERNFEVL